MCIHLFPPFCFCLCIPPQLCLCCCIIYQSPSHSFHLPKSIPFISSTNISFIHFIYHSPSLSYFPSLVMLMLHGHSALLSQYIKQHDFCLNIFIHELISRLMYPSLIFANITWCQKWDTNESRQRYQLLKLLSSSPIIKLHYLQINKNRLTDGQV